MILRSAIYLLMIHATQSVIQNTKNDEPEVSKTTYIKKLSNIVSKPKERFVQYLQDGTEGVKSVVNKGKNGIPKAIQNQIVNVINSGTDTCESEMIDGKLQATAKGKSDCEKMCKGLPKQIQNALAKISKYTSSMVNLDKYIRIEVNNDPNTNTFECVLNLTEDALLCNCPHAARFYISETTQKQIDAYLRGDTNKRDFVVLPGLILIILAFFFCPIWVPLLIITAPLWLPVVLIMFG